MKKIILIGMLLCCAVGCRQHRSLKMIPAPEGEDGRDHNSDTFVISEEGGDSINYLLDKDVLYYPPVVLDTLVNDYHIHYKRIYNDVVIEQSGFKYADNSLILNIDYKGKNIMNNKEFRTSSFSNVIPVGEKPKYQFWTSSIVNATDSCIIFDLGFWMPESDVGFQVELKVLNDGSYSYRELVEEDSEE